MAAPVVLLIDDDPDDRASMRGLLQEAGFHVMETASAKQALHYLTSDEPLPSLIVTDLAMPDMSGWEFVNIINAYVRLSVIPLLVVSGVEQQRRRFPTESVRRFFTKPIDSTTFVSAVKQWVPLQN